MCVCACVCIHRHMIQRLAPDSQPPAREEGGDDGPAWGHVEAMLRPCWGHVGAMFGDVVATMTKVDANSAHVQAMAGPR